MHDMTLNEYQELAQRTSRNHDHNQILNGAMGLCGESGEIMDYIKKWQFQGHTFDPNKVIDELGDVLWYCAELAAGLAVNLATVAKLNIEKLKRRYPDGFTAERSISREELK